MHWLERTELLLVTDKLERLKKANVLVVGLGGVGTVAAEMICRAGIGKMTIVDGDNVEISNRKRQLSAMVSTTGKPKTHIMEQRFMDVNSELELTVVNEFICDHRTEELLDSQSFDYVVDTIDTLSPKVFLIHQSVQRGLRIVSSMGAGCKLDPSQVQVSDLSATFNCKLARMMHKRLSRLGIQRGVQVVFSPEPVDVKAVREEKAKNKKSTVGTISYMPAVFGCFIASITIREMLNASFD